MIARSVEPRLTMRQFAMHTKNRGVQRIESV
jgi:hypothetical protein